MRIERKAEGDFMKQMDTIADRNREFLKNEEPHRPCDGSTQHAPLAPSISVQGNAAFALLKQIAIENEVHFKQNCSGEYSSRLSECCSEIARSSDLLQRNGFRSLVCVCDMVILQIIALLRTISESRSMVMFRITHYCKEMEGFGAVFRFLVLSIQQVLGNSHHLEPNSLFPPLDGDYSQYHALLKGIEALDASCFYARALGFQFSPSVCKIFRFIGVVLATYSLCREGGHGPLGTLIHSGRFFLSPEQRAERIIKVTREADIDFCRGFWNLSELGSMGKWFCPKMAVCDLRDIAFVGPISLETTSGKKVLVPEPSAHTGHKPVRIRVISYLHREGVSCAPNRASLSSNLVIHCHGGGYVATSSKSHETYLRSWAKSLNCTVVSIDYSLAPENPFPRATEEVIYAYAWMISNPSKVGWTGERVVMVGDSAGGNLVMSANLRLIELDVKRIPDGLVPVYTPFLFQYLPSPSRVLSFMDPLLHMGVVLRCVEAYTADGADSAFGDGTDSVFSDETDSDFSCTTPSAAEPTSHNLHHNGHKSLQEYVDQVQKAACSTSRRPLSHKRTFSQSLADTAALAAGHAFDNLSGWFERSGPVGFGDKAKLDRVASLTPQMAAELQQEDIVGRQSQFYELLKINIPRDPLISPMYASPDVLKRLPPISFVACHLDPLLDDSIQFARKLRDSGGTVKNLDLLDGLPHGFLNFTLMSQECQEGSRVCLNRIRNFFGLPDTTTD